MDSESHTNDAEVSKEDIKLALDTIGVQLPVAHFGKGFENVEQMLTDLIVSVTRETKCIDSHLKNTHKEDPTMNHLRNTNQTIGNILSMLDQLFHYNHHALESKQHLDKVEIKTQNLDKKFSKHEPMFNHVSDKIKEMRRQDERGKQIYE